MGNWFEFSFLDEICSKVDLVDLIGCEVQFKCGGQNFVVCCLFYEEKMFFFNVLFM